MTTDNQAETQPAPLDQTVEGILARAGALVTRSAHTPMTGHFEREDPLTGDSLRVSLDDADDFEGVTVKLKVAKWHLEYKPDGEVRRLFRNGSERIYSLGYGVNPELSPKIQRQALGCIAISPEVFDSLVEEPEQLP